MKKIGMMATYPKRKESLTACLKTIIPQLDLLYIYCNGYSVDGLSVLSSRIASISEGCTVKIIDPSFASGDIKDMGKFWAIHAVRGYIFLLDDDLLYPEDYCEEHIRWIDEHKQVSTVHGRSIDRFPLTDYFLDTRSLHYRREIKEPKIVDVAGTGTVAFCTVWFPSWHPVPDATLEFFAGMGDIFFARRMDMAGKPIIAMPRPKNWLRDTIQSNGTSLYVQARHDTSKHCDILNKCEWNHLK